jgi:hypothetical protein
VCGKVGYFINVDNTVPRKSRVQNYCGPPNLHGVEKIFLNNEGLRNCIQS